MVSHCKKAHWAVMVLVSIGFGQVAFAQLGNHECKGLSFLPVDIDPSEALLNSTYFDKFTNAGPLEASCLAKDDVTTCKVERAFKMVDSYENIFGTEVYRMHKMSALAPEKELAIQNLYQSPIVKAALNNLYQARLLAKDYMNLCNPVLLYTGSREWFGLGPVFTDGKTYEVDGFLYHDLIDLSGAQIAGKEVLSPQALQRNGYFDVAMAHEITHAMMQTLYEMDGFTDLIKSIHTKELHSSSTVSDLSLAWIEGFAEAYETYYAIKFNPSLIDKAFPAIQRFYDHYTTLEQSYEESTVSFASTIAIGIPVNMYKHISDLDQFVVEYLMAERLAPVMLNDYSMEGTWINLINRYGTVFFPEITLQEMTRIDHSKSIFNQTQAYSREGWVATIIFELLQLGLESDMLNILAKHRPKHIHEFLHLLIDDQMAKGKAERLLTKRIKNILDPNLRNPFTKCAGHFRGLGMSPNTKIALVKQNCDPIADTLQYDATTLKRILASPLAESYLEFQSGLEMRKIFTGQVDRINLSTAPAHRLVAYFKSVSRSGDQELKKLWNNLPMRYQEEFLINWMSDIDNANFSRETPRPTGLQILLKKIITDTKRIDPAESDNNSKIIAFLNELRSRVIEDRVSF